MATVEFRHEYYGANGIAFIFSGKPNERIRSALKANGFRWSPSAGLWYRMRSGEWADLACCIRKMIEGDPNADQVMREQQEADRRRIAADDFDLANNRSL